MEGIGKGLLILFVCVIVLACLGGCALLGTYNSVIGADIGVQTAWANVQAMYQRRLDLSNQVVPAVNSGSDKELAAVALLAKQAKDLSSAFKKDPITGQALPPTTPEEAKALQDKMAAFDQANIALLAFTSANPQWQSTPLFRDFITLSEGSENRVAVARRDYNTAVAGYWGATKYLPGSLVAGMMGYFPTRYAQFAADAGASSAPVPAFK